MDPTTTCIPIEPQPSSKKRRYLQMDNHFTNEILSTPAESTARMNDLLYCRASVSVEIAGEYLENAMDGEFPFMTYFQKNALIDPLIAMRSLSQANPDYVTVSEALELISNALDANSKTRAITYRHRHLELSAEKKENAFDPSELVLCTKVEDESVSWSRTSYNVCFSTTITSSSIILMLYSDHEARVLFFMVALVLSLVFGGSFQSFDVARRIHLACPFPCPRSYCLQCSC
ncbi:hypothetical protein F5880DRAFT_1580330 [Lentinula raphanica]|nr:hypothetical protein F5880DRAFT_1580330 [Lentinula raphanica]